MNLSLQILFFFVCLTPHSRAQHEELEIMMPYIIGGKWTGNLIQQSGGIAKNYFYEIELSVKDSLISGTAIIQTNTDFCQFELSGKIRTLEVQLEDVRITDEKIKNRAAWCIKQMKLQFLFKEGSYRLEGSWYGNSKIGKCQPGLIILKKETVRA
jgi:hypothetical protein